jgi:threonine/homoserine/homoserine lactone efflux protein
VEVWINGLLGGALMGVVVSLAPGVNSALCIGLARSGRARARPIILAAAFTDCAYCLLSSLGLLATARIDAGLLRWVSVVFLALAAIGIWPRSPSGDVGPLALVALNPGTLAIWLGICSVHDGPGRSNPQAVLALALGALLATGCWFWGLAYISSRLSDRLCWLNGDRIGQAFSLVLGALAGLRAVMLCM